jgi:hypothetical protein
MKIGIHNLWILFFAIFCLMMFGFSIYVGIVELREAIPNIIPPAIFGVCWLVWFIICCWLTRGNND